MKVNTVVLQAVLLLLSFVSHAVSQQEIVLGQFSAQTGTNAPLGIQRTVGLSAAVQQINRWGGVHNGTKLRLLTYDDGDVAAAGIQRGLQLIYNDSVFALVSCSGTQQVLGVQPSAIAAGVPQIIAIGSPALRTPYQPYTISLRANAYDECTAAVYFLMGKLHLKRIAILYQNDSFGLPGLVGMTNALASVGMTLAVAGAYQHLSTDVTEAVEALLSANPPVQAIFFMSIVGPAISATQMMRADPRCPPDVVFVLNSVITAEVFRSAIDPQFYSRIYTIQHVPNPSDTSWQLVRNYQEAMNAAYPGRPYEFVTLETYMNGRFVAEVFNRMPIISQRNFVEAVYATKSFQIDDFMLGMFYGDCVQNVPQCNCSQGGKTVTFHELLPSGQFQVVKGATFSWPETTCMSSPSMLRLPFTFAMIGANKTDGSDAASGPR